MGQRVGIVVIGPVLFSVILSGVFALRHAGVDGVETSSSRERPMTSVVSSDPEASALADIRGMTISCQTWGWEWGTDEMVASMAELKAMGATWITIHPYASIRGDGRVSMGRLDPSGPAPEWIARPIREAHALGMRIMIKPHLAYWGSGFSWRGDITFTDDEAWATFFREYDAWITTMAKMSQEADLFVIGTELDRTLAHDKQWRAIAESVRTVFDGPLTYAANWSHYEEVGFWDALDVIGIQAYFPLAVAPLMPDGDTSSPSAPTEAVLRRGWSSVMRDLVSYSDRLDRPIVFTELGYNRSHRAPFEPWEYRQDGADAIPVQVACLGVALQAILDEPAVIGAFLWKWFPGSPVQGNFAMAAPETRAVIQDHWNPQVLDESSTDASSTSSDR